MRQEVKTKINPEIAKLTQDSANIDITALQECPDIVSTDLTAGTDNAVTIINQLKSILTTFINNSKQS